MHECSEFGSGRLNGTSFLIEILCSVLPMFLLTRTGSSAMVITIVTATWIPELRDHGDERDNDNNSNDFDNDNDNRDNNNNTIIVTLSSDYVVVRLITITVMVIAMVI